MCPQWGPRQCQTYSRHLKGLCRGDFSGAIGYATHHSISHSATHGTNEDHSHIPEGCLQNVMVLNVLKN